MRLTMAVWLAGAAAACSPPPMMIIDAGIPPRPPRPAIEVAAGDSHACARMADGAVRCWGTYQNGSLQPPTDDGGYPGVVAGIDHTLALAVGVDLSCARLGDGGASCWGSGDAGQLGNGHQDDSDAPMSVIGLSSPLVDIAAGDRHVCVRQFDGTALCWGSNEQGQLGDGNPARYESTPASLGMVGLTQLDLGHQHSCALRVSGTAVCWGDNSHSQLGDQTTATRNTPVPVTGAGSGSQVSAGSNSCLLTDAKTLTCWGTLDDFPGTDPTPVPGFANIAQLSVGSGHVCARLEDRTVVCSGDNTFGQLGDGTTVSRIDGGVVPGLGDVTQVSAGNGFTCAVINDGGVQCWGRNALGQLGDGTHDDRATPKAVQF